MKNMKGSKEMTPYFFELTHGDGSRRLIANSPKTQTWFDPRSNLTPFGKRSVRFPPLKTDLLVKKGKQVLWVAIYLGPDK